MRLLGRAQLRGLSLAAITAALALFATELSAASFRGGKGFSAGGRSSFSTQRMVRPRATMPRVSQSRVSQVPRATRIATPHKPHKPYPPTRPPRGPVVGEKTPPPGGVVRPPYHPTDPRRPTRPPWVGPAIGTGIAIGTVGAATASPPPPPPPPSFGGPSGPSGPLGPQGPSGPSGPGVAIDIPPVNEQRFVPNEVVLEFAGNYPPQAITELARRHRLARLDQVNLPSTNSTYFRARIIDGRPVRGVLNALRIETTLRAGQPNYLYAAAQPTFEPPAAAMPSPTPVAATAGALPAMGGTQYALGKLRLQEAHGLTRGNNVLVAVIDSGIDASHPELRGVIAGTFDALGKAEKPHMHGTAIAGTIAARSQLTGVAPAARILAIRAFGASGNSAAATTFAVIKGIDHAISQRARVINMSFNGPADPGMARALAAARSRGIVLVAAAGNLGANSPPQYPAADPNVIAVSATDAEDNLFKSSNRGGHIAVAAPGVDILVPIPDSNYDLTSGTSFAAAHVSGIVALILERKPNLDPDSVRNLLLSTAKDLGPAGKDEQFGAGLVDAYQAILALESRTVAGPDTPAAR